MGALARSLGNLPFGIDCPGGAAGIGCGAAAHLVGQWAGQLSAVRIEEAAGKLEGAAGWLLEPLDR